VLRLGICENGSDPSVSIKSGEFLDFLSNGNCGHGV
jgi:hypothetical protein